MVDFHDVSRTWIFLAATRFVPASNEVHESIKMQLLDRPWPESRGGEWKSRIARLKRARRPRGSREKKHRGTGVKSARRRDACFSLKRSRQVARARLLHVNPSAANTASLFSLFFSSFPGSFSVCLVVSANPDPLRDSVAWKKMLISPDQTVALGISIYVQGGKKGLSVAVMDEFYTDLMEIICRKIHLDFEFQGK